MTGILQGKRAAFFTLGCKLNFAETSEVGRQLKAAGVATAARGEQADICFINTCSVTEVADHKCRQAIRRMAKCHPGSFVVVTGCYAQLQPQQVAAIDGVDLVVGTEDKGRIVQLLAERIKDKGQRTKDNEQGIKDEGTGIVTCATKDIRSFAPSCSCGGRTRYFLKVQDGCDYYCTYCTIPFARGRSRNGTVASMVQQAREAAEAGAQEIVLTGVNIGDFGKTTGETFLDLIRALDEVEGIARYRISSIEPNLLTEEVMQFCAQSRAFMPHFHIPLQCGSDEVLRLMHRRYDTALFRSRVERVVELMPDAFIGVDVIVGMRGETQALFDEAERFIESLPVAQLHVFPYSERPGTKALGIQHVVTPEEKRERSQRLLAISDAKTDAFYNRYIGHEAEVLVERGKCARLFHGFTPNYIKVDIAMHNSQCTMHNAQCTIHNAQCTMHNGMLDNTLRRVRLAGWNSAHDALNAELI